MKDLLQRIAIYIALGAIVTFIVLLMMSGEVSSTEAASATDGAVTDVQNY